MSQINVNLSDFDNGSLQERFNHEFEKVVENTLDPNTPFKKKRQVVITLDIYTDEYRDDVLIDAEVKSKIVPREPVTTKVAIGRDDHGVVAHELKSGARGQMYFDADDSTLKDDKGVAVDQLESESKEPNVLKFKDAK